MHQSDIQPSANARRLPERHYEPSNAVPTSHRGVPMGEKVTVDSDPSPVFIIGGSRTGSEMHKTILNLSREINIVNETWFLCPWWLHTDFAAQARRSIGNLSDDAGAAKMVDLMYSRKLFGYFWTTIDQEIDRNILQAELARSDRTPRAVLAIVMKLHAQAKNKAVPGAKFPVHYSYAGKLIEWFPNCRIVHTVRDPRAVHSSQAVKYLREHHTKLERVSMRAVHFAHISIQSWWTARIHTQLRGYRNYYMSRYEDVVRDPEASIRKLCEFLEIEASETMLQPIQYGSSYRRSKPGVRGINQESVDAWKSKLNRVTIGLINVLNRKALQTFGYV